MVVLPDRCLVDDYTVEASTNPTPVRFPAAPDDPYARGVISVPGIVYLAVYWGCILLGLAALVDAAIRRTDAYPAADRRTKQFWLLLLGGGLLAQIVFPALSGGLLSILALGGIVAAIVYLVDVRRRLIEVTRGPRW
jgi:hypothetical protein